MKKVALCLVPVIAWTVGCTHSPNPTITSSPTEKIERWPSAVAGEGVAQKVTGLSQQVLTDRRFIEDKLASKAHILTRELNFQAQGQIEGKISGSYKGDGGLNLKGALVGALLGGLGASAVGGMASLLGSSMGLEQLLMSGGLLGAVGGSLLPSGATAKVEGSLQGQYEAKGWENHYEARHFVVTVVDPELVRSLENVRGEDRSSCFADILQAQKTLLESGRTFTPAEAGELAAALERIRKNVTSLQMAAVDYEMDAAASQKIMNFTEAMSKWMNKRLSLISFGRHDLNMKSEAGVLYSLDLVADSVYFPPYFPQELKNITVRAILPGSAKASTKDEYANIIAQWNMAASQAADHLWRIMAEKDKEARRIEYYVRGSEGKSLSLGVLRATPQGIFLWESGLLKKKGKILEVGEVLNVRSLQTSGVRCRTRTEANEFLGQTSRMAEMYFGYVDGAQVSNLLKASPIRALPQSKLTDGGFLN